MHLTRHLTERVSASFLFVLLAFCVRDTGRCQVEAASAADIIRFLTYQSNRPGKQAFMAGVFTCGSSNEDRAAAKSLVRMGNAAIVELERALDSIEKSGQQSEFAPNAGWLLLAYSRIKGRAAYPRLKRMDDAPELLFLQNRIDSSIALSLSLTSYVSGSQVLARRFRCRPGQPRDALDQFILAWLRNDRVWLQSSLGPAARSALDRQLERRTWAQMRAALWPSNPGRRMGLGYYLDAPSEWSEPEETLDDIRGDGGTEADYGVEFVARFRSSLAGECGSQNIVFLKTDSPVRPGYLTYLIDNSDIDKLLSLVASCAVEAAKSR